MGKHEKGKRDGFKSRAGFVPTAIGSAGWYGKYLAIPIYMVLCQTGAA